MNAILAQHFDPFYATGLFLKDTKKEKLFFTPFSTIMTVWLLLIFFKCLLNQLSCIYSIITRIKEDRC